MLKIATWNVNSLRVRLSHVLQWLQEHQPDILALQEIKLIDDDFPVTELQQAGYQCIFSGQKTYNGVAILSKQPMTDKQVDLPSFSDSQRRILLATVGDVRVVNLYIPNGESVVSEKYQYKLTWLQHVEQLLKQELQTHAKVVVLGDFNIAPEDRDVHDPAAWAGKVLCSELERVAFQSMLKLGFQDCFRLFEQSEKTFSWWDYRMNAFKRKMGLRIDHILASPALAKQCVRCYIDPIPRGWERPSDHTPVVGEYN